MILGGGVAACLFTFVGASRGHLCDSTAFLLSTAGSYSEMYTFVSPNTPLLPKRPSNPNAAFIVSAFKTAGNLDSLDPGQ